MGTEIPTFYTVFNSVTPFCPEPCSQSTLFKEFGSVDFHCLAQTGIQKINPKEDVFSARYFCFIRTKQYTGQNFGTMFY